MTPVSEKKKDDRMEQILELIPKLANLEPRQPKPLSGQGDEIDAIIAGLNTLSEELNARLAFVKNDEERINGIMELLLKYTLLDFSQKAPLSGKGDELDAISAGLNTLVEELDFSLKAEKKNTSDLERINALLMDSEQQVQAIISNAPSAIIIIDAESNIIRWNPKAEKYFGWKPEEIIGTPLSKIIVPYPDSETPVKELKQLLKTVTREVLNDGIEMQGIDKRGRLFDVSLDISASVMIGKKVFICFARDITENKKSNEKLRQSEDRYHLLVNEIADYAIIRLDNNGIISSWNKGAEKMKGYTEDEIIGKHFSVFYTEEDKKKGVPENAIAIAKKNGRFVYKGWRVRKDKSLFWADIAITELKDNKGKRIGFVKVTKDLTEQRKAEEELLRSQKFLTSIFENIPNMVFIKDARQLKFIGLNKAGESLLGYERKDLINKSDYDFFPKEEAEFFINKDREVLKTGELHEISEEFIHTKNKGVRILETKKIPIFDKDGNPEYLLGISNDITERKKADIELKQKSQELLRSNQELEQFAYVASHDLQEPLRMVTSYLQLLESRYKDRLDADANDFINFAVDGATRMRSLINSLLEYSRVNRLKVFEKFSINAVMEDILNDLKDQLLESHVTIKYDNLPTIYGDPVLISQLIMNLIVNAIKFKDGKDPQITITAKRGKGEWLFCIEDNGIGIQKEYFDKIFVIFQRLNSKEKYPGTGIGLSICKKIVERHGGKIWVESEVNKGSRFYFTIKDDLVSPV
jgi:PAS domain S-box-containing protein